MASKKAGGEKSCFVLLRHAVMAEKQSRATLPPVIPPPPLSADRREYLDANIRQFMRNPALLNDIVHVQDSSSDHEAMS